MSHAYCAHNCIVVLDSDLSDYWLIITKHKGMTLIALCSRTFHSSLLMCNTEVKLIYAEENLDKKQ